MVRKQIIVCDDKTRQYGDLLSLFINIVNQLSLIHMKEGKIYE